MSAGSGATIPPAIAFVARAGKSGSRCHQARRRARDALAKVGVKDREDHRPAQLSGGEQQRVAIARAVVNEPKVLLADEPTGSLDDASADEVLRLFGELNQSGVTILVVTHDMSVAARARRILGFKHGRLATEQTGSA